MLAEDPPSKLTAHSIDPNKSYYISFKIVTPSVYLDMGNSGGYEELYYYNEDQSSTLDWTTADAISDYHAFSRLYAVTTSSSAPTGGSIPCGLPGADPLTCIN